MKATIHTWSDVNRIKTDLDIYLMKNQNIPNLEQLHNIGEKLEVLHKRLKKEFYDVFGDGDEKNK